MLEFIAFCDKWQEDGWQSKGEAVQEAYVNSELHRLVAEGLPVLRAVLTCPDPLPQFLALRLIREGVDSTGNASIELNPVYLRLVDPHALAWVDPRTGERHEGVATPPQVDPQGRPVPKDKLGTLIAKVGNVGGNLGVDRDANACMAVGGDRRAVNVMAKRNLYITREVTREPKAYPLREAILILSQWGFGIGENQFRSQRDRSGQRGQCCWLVEELSADTATEYMLRARATAARSNKRTEKPGEV